MSVKLISLNIGVQLELEVDGKQKLVTWSAVCPSKGIPQPYDMMYYLAQWLEDSFGTDYAQVQIPIAKPKRLKPHRTISQAEFNRRKRELGYAE